MVRKECGASSLIELPISVRMSRSNVDRATVKNQTCDIQKGIFAVNSANLVVASPRLIQSQTAVLRSGENLIKPKGGGVCHHLHLKHQLFDVISALCRP